MKHSLHMLGGVVDRSYRGNVTVILYNWSSMTYEVQQGDKTSQFILERFSKPPIVLVDEPISSDREISGFRSSGNSVQDITRAGSNHITILNHQESQHTHPSTRMSDIQRFLNENKSLQPRMADYLGYASELRYGDVLPLLLHALVLVLAAVERFFIWSTIVRPRGLPYKLPNGGADQPIIGTGVPPATLRSTTGV